MLVFRYSAVRGVLAGLTIADIQLAPDVRGLELEVLPSSDASLAVNVAEDGGGNYQCFAWLPANRWTRLSLPLEEFWLAENSQDPDGRLDPRAVRRLTLLDLANLPGQVGLALGLKDGPQCMVLGRIAFTRGAVEQRSFFHGLEALLDPLDRSPMLFLPIGGPALTIDPEVDSALRLEYALGGYRWAGLVRGMGHLARKNAVGVKVAVRAEPPILLQVVAEERDGSKYFSVVPVQTASEWTDAAVEFSRMRLSPDTADENGQLDPEQLRVIILVADTFSSPLKVGQRGRVWLKNLRIIYGPQAR
ncbi:MAG: hypothetical protein H5T86_08590 [Armatimonadetes bacterium]|nr:hypothetical protein [Armatimonadota bacterium]